ncbi:uncharacterized protein PGTG_01811 [Puccinia graminis f. sp. tritici CRL 75-36-700-3]|uniref:Uncharacterized protein n=1 Tax=Puccinia graminis f. sp. tritici (strain CRL 75-36-700-3 / race SCCL) TaxID=418459 RepID=E3JTE4_PUCGT|nr:uncharacterized protein PGTG_01811 [Puccinia graminis f. sp. tritici CRL 75-36-700-3]EFP75218.1 hypothetical protein PGTG_01811 [Puccinia graminis f. sp. tritici CRL 75-36-700-3]
MGIASLVTMIQKWDESKFQGTTITAPVDNICGDPVSVDECIGQVGVQLRVILTRIRLSAVKGGASKSIKSNKPLNNNNNLDKPATFASPFKQPALVGLSSSHLGNVHPCPRPMNMLLVAQSSAHQPDIINNTHSALHTQISSKNLQAAAVAALTSNLIAATNLSSRATITHSPISCNLSLASVIVRHSLCLINLNGYTKEAKKEIFAPHPNGICQYLLALPCILSRGAEREGWGLNQGGRVGKETTWRTKMKHTQILALCLKS